ncbi:hypothetical protein CGZ90_06295 [Fictibacillus aquaticus]|uniref:Uncharacterized protein n=1 Tax=Fictibacillus aquaticus TaxID=2021314 RepID=A0A235FEY8_9BACL|nr:hypothetical protein CGZ90_06295 [Fictibacillus aquaticus]
MKMYAVFVFSLFVTWIIVSHLYPEPSWWSIFTSNRSTHTALMEQISLNKVAFAALMSIGVPYIVRKLFQNT